MLPRGVIKKKESHWKAHFAVWPSLDAGKDFLSFNTTMYRAGVMMYLLCSVTNLTGLTEPSVCVCVLNGVFTSSGCGNSGFYLWTITMVV